ncbi:MAG: hypothetical protein ACK526_10770 [Planctomyces sp.]|jgi:hypothetical protein
MISAHPGSRQPAPMIRSEEPTPSDEIPASDISQETDATQGPPTVLRRAMFFLVNAWLVMHLTAIFTAPATVGPSSQTSRNIWEVVAPYLQGLYLNHGFHYFAPQPGSSNLVSWTVTKQDGTSVSGRFPNFDIKPRLFYHRHFMMSEFLGNSPPELQAVIVKSYARNLCRVHGGETVSLSAVRHDLPSMERVRAGGKLTDSDLYEESPLGYFSKEDLK